MVLEARVEVEKSILTIDEPPMLNSKEKIRTDGFQLPPQLTLIAYKS